MLACVRVANVIGTCNCGSKAMSSGIPGSRMPSSRTRIGRSIRPPFVHLVVASLVVLLPRGVIILLPLRILMNPPLLGFG